MQDLYIISALGQSQCLDRPTVCSCVRVYIYAKHAVSMYLSVLIWLPPHFCLSPYHGHDMTEAFTLLPVYNEVHYGMCVTVRGV